MIKKITGCIAIVIASLVVAAAPSQATPLFGKPAYWPPSIGLPEGQITVTPTCDSLVVDVCTPNPVSPFKLSMKFSVRDSTGAWRTIFPAAAFTVPRIGSCTHIFNEYQQVAGYLHRMVLPFEPLVAETFDTARVASLALLSTPFYNYRVTTPSGTYILNAPGSFNFSVPACPTNATLNAVGSCTGVKGTVCIATANANNRLIKAFRIDPFTGQILALAAEIVPTVAAVNRCATTQRTLEFTIPVNGTNNLIPGDTVRLVMSHVAGKVQNTRLRQGTTGPLVTTVRLMDPGQNSCLLLPPPHPF